MPSARFPSPPLSRSRLTVLFAVLFAGCGKPSPPLPPTLAGATAPPASAATLSSSPGATTAADPAAPPPPPLPPKLDEPEDFIALGVKGHDDAIVSVPGRARGKRPVVIATHGNYDRPEWQCAVWRGIVGDQVFVLCPRGKQRDDSPSRSDIRFTYASNQALGVEITAALAALVERFPDHVDLERPLYTGFSLGAIMGVRIAARTPDRFPRLVLVEGGQDNWTDATSRAFAKGGGQRVMFVCSQPQCNLDAASAARRIERAGSKARVVRGPAGDHRYDGPIAQATKAVIAWVLEGDERFGVGDAVRTTPAVP